MRTHGQSRWALQGEVGRQTRVTSGHRLRSQADSPSKPAPIMSFGASNVIFPYLFSQLPKWGFFSPFSIVRGLLFVSPYPHTRQKSRTPDFVGKYASHCYPHGLGGVSLRRLREWALISLSHQHPRSQCLSRRWTHSCLSERR